MRGIERVLAAVLLIGAVAGAAVFASHSVSNPGADAVRLAAPPEQHLSGPGAVLIAPTPADRSQGLRVVRAAPAVVSIPAIRQAGVAALIEPAKQTVRLHPLTPVVPTPVAAPTLSPSPVAAPVAPVQAPPAVTGPVVTAAPEAPRAPAASDPLPAPPAPVADPPSVTTPAPPIQVTPVPVQTLPDPPPDLHGLGLAPGPQPTPVDSQAPPYFKAGPGPSGD